MKKRLTIAIATIATLVLGGLVASAPTLYNSFQDAQRESARRQSRAESDRRFAELKAKMEAEFDPTTKYASATYHPKWWKAPETAEDKADFHRVQQTLEKELQSSHDPANFVAQFRDIATEEVANKVYEDDVKRLTERGLRATGSVIAYPKLVYRNRDRVVLQYCADWRGHQAVDKDGKRVLTGMLDRNAQELAFQPKDGKWTLIRYTKTDVRCDWQRQESNAPA